MGSTVECLTAEWTEQPVEELHACDEDAALVRRAQAGDQMAFREIVDRYQTKVFSVIRRMVRDTNDAEDIAQEVFANAFLAIRSYKSRGSLFSWIYRITVNQCYEYLRRKKVRRLVYEADFQEEAGRGLETKSAAPPVDATLAQRDLALKLLSRLCELDRSLLLLKEVEGYSVEELSAMTGINLSSIKVKLFRARRKMVKAAGRNGHSLHCRSQW